MIVFWGHNNFLIWAQSLRFNLFAHFAVAVAPRLHSAKAYFQLVNWFSICLSLSMCLPPCATLLSCSPYPFFVHPRSFVSNICCIPLQLIEPQPVHVMQMPTSTPAAFAICPCARLWLALVLAAPEPEPEPKPLPDPEPEPEPALTAALNWLSVLVPGVICF